MYSIIFINVLEIIFYVYGTNISFNIKIKLLLKKYKVKDFKHYKNLITHNYARAIFRY